MNFEALNLDEDLIRAVHDMGFVEPTAIQEKTIPEIISGDRDLVGRAQTGTGKTAAFGLPMIQLIDHKLKHIQGVVICPTRELCMQITRDIKAFGKYVKGSKTVAIYGGASIENQIREIKKGVQIVVATPGRLRDLIKRKVVSLTRIQYLVLDEADEMLNMGFQEDIDEILKKTPENKRTWLFSATMPREVAKIARNYMNDQVEVIVGKKNSSADNISHVNYLIKEKDRYLALKRIIDYYPDIYGLIFCRTRKETQSAAEQLIKDGYDAESLHGDLSQGQRDKVMQRFRERNLQILVATDVAARGIDVKDITHVINYRLPDEPDNYTHRCGRTARAGKSGISIVLMNVKEKRRLSDVERKAGIKFRNEKVPSGNSICTNQLYAMVNRLVATEVNQEEIGKFLPPVFDILDGITKEELIQKFVSMEFNRFLNYYKNSVDINIKPGKKMSGKDRKQSVHFEQNDTQRFFMSAGASDDIKHGTIVRFLCDKAKIKSDKIGKIEIMKEFTLFDIDKTVAEKVLKSMKGVSLDGRKVNIKFDEKKKVSSKGAVKRKGAKIKSRKRRDRRSRKGGSSSR